MVELEEQLEIEIKQLFDDEKIPYTVTLFVNYTNIGEELVKIAERNEVGITSLSV
ncbi:hypothetical protein [Desulforhopalus singaporensis]|uniref:Uncharacterized protein n=1 Tax=Desulforhopalus singaporensis TaxID=91360 RepID=A0A1H0W8D8_9BACT|nr:hypothetical protein [Desulforhopalus singaporensis]SDP86731.1 hypothetical protein SAMN05660330_04452 [Desulforhopalus singaporensis]